jgi:hypothetical protein
MNVIISKGKDSTVTIPEEGITVVKTLTGCDFVCFDGGEAWNLSVDDFTTELLGHIYDLKEGKYAISFTKIKEEQWQ